MPMPSLPARVSISPDVLCQHVEGQAVLLHLEAERYHSLDPVGTRVWSALTDDPDVERLVATMLGEFDVEEPQLRADLSTLFGSLADAGLVTVHE